ncbi:hypothetical protein FKY78_13055 [Enterococcus faecalis]|uniref:hypothetical protein n=1 Tax=Enterococcus faecalis TaxID=1351 RepID=UPI000933E44D|nr:hypothetical protein [Enterococcus faecalis]MBD9857641.1 hypothetical protein [Enterococcus faecalis]MBP4100794.1 hypothetical protein [Enterococcus faecalis]MBT0787057.1 hypothetical protein [Enterococcus faecalis]MDK4410903.1 hypothetical protein [Enterococcus faecalis]NSV52028.1 hypothetical protein [Enterococcus faecalis]
MYVSFVLSCLLGFSGYSLLNRLNSLEFVDAWLDKETLKITLKRCFYDRSFKKQTLKELERVYFKLKEIINVQTNKRSLNTNDIRNVRELEEKQQEIKRFMLDVLEDAYWKELANMPEDQRHLDDWDFF